MGTRRRVPAAPNHCRRQPGAATMQAAQKATGQPSSVKIYNAVYSSVQVYECMVRGIAVMRRRGDSFVNATQILKVAGVDKGRRTKILEKEILPGKHEIVQGGYGKYQGTWIPIERGRDIALQYGVAPLLAPLFDFTPNTNPMSSSIQNPNSGAVGSPRPLSASSSFSSLGPAGNYAGSSLAPPPILPGSALRLLNQGRAQGLFTPSMSTLAPSSRPGSFSNSYFPTPYSQSSSFQGASPTPPNHSQSLLKRTRSDAEQSVESTTDIQMIDASRSPSSSSHRNADESPNKRARKDSSPGMTAHNTRNQLQSSSQANPQSHPGTSTRQELQSRGPTPSNGLSRPPSSLSVAANGKATNKSPDTDVRAIRFSSKASTPRPLDPSAALKDARRAAVIGSIYQHDDPALVLDLLRQITPDNSSVPSLDINLVLDDHGHTALHLAASMARQHTVDILLANGADPHRGNYEGETPLIRACLSTHNADVQSFQTLVGSLYPSIRTLDTSRRSVVHHIVALAGIKGRAVSARYYLDQIFFWIAQHQGGDFKSIVDLQDEHGDTALNIAARVGNRSLVRTLLDVGANRILPNKLGLRPGDFGVETEELNGGPRADDILSSLRSGPSIPTQKSHDLIADMTSMIQGLSSEFAQEIKAKQDSLDVTQAHLRAATRELSEKRKQIQAWQSRCAELDQVNQRIRNLEKAVVNEDNFDWTGRTDLNGDDAREVAGSAFQFRGQSSTMVGLGGAVDVSFNVEAEPPLPTGDTVASLIKLRRMKMWHARMEGLMTARLKGLQGASTEKEYQCRKIVSLCTGIPIDKVEEMLENLVIAVESEAQIVDIGRVSGFMQKVRDGVI